MSKMPKPRADILAEAERALWASLPVPALLIGLDDRILDINAASEGFLNLSAKAVTGAPVWDVLAVDSPLEDAFARARASGTTLFVNDVDVGSGQRAPLQSQLQIAPLSGSDGVMILMISPRELAGRLTQNNSVKSSAKSAIGMAEMLAHEIKNPLAGITGAAQLLSMNLTPQDQELTDLIVAESRRIVKLLEQVEQFLAAAGLGRQGPVASGCAQSDQERRRSGRGRRRHHPPAQLLRAFLSPAPLGRSRHRTALADRGDRRRAGVAGEHRRRCVRSLRVGA